jgi:hypothetical protein
VADTPDDGWSTPTTSGRSRSGNTIAQPTAPDAGADDGWGPATSVRTGRRPAGATRSAPPVDDPRPDTEGTQRPERSAATSAPEWAPAGPLSGREQRATRKADRVAAATRTPARERMDRAVRAPERGLPWWAALLMLLAIAGIGGLLDTIGLFGLKGGFNIGIVVASVVAILVVKRSQMFPIVIAPPIVYSAAALLQLYIRSSGLHDKKVVFDAAANYLVYGFPAIASATAAVLIIAGFRLIIRR